MTLHRLLLRQLRRHVGDPDAVPEALRPLLQVVSDTYAQADEDRALLERSLDLSSEELIERNRRAEAKSLGMLSALPDLVVYVSAADTVLDCRSPWPEALACPPLEAVQRPVAQVLAPGGALAAALPGALRQARSAETLHVEELEDRWADGEARDLELRVTPLSHGEALVLVRDISQRKRAERARREIRERFELAVLGSADGLWDWDLHTGRVFYSARLRELIGAAPEDLGDHIEAFEARIHPEDRERVWAAVSAHLASQVPYNETCRLLHRDGAYRWFQLRGHASWDAAGAAVRMAGSIRDITELKAKERELERARDAAETASRAKDEFLANMSHEIRTPMNAMLGLNQLLLEGDLRPRDRALAANMLEAARALLALIDDVLDVSLIESGSLALLPVPFSIPTMVREVFGIFDAKAKAKGLVMQLILDPGLPDQAIGDPRRIRQVLAGLLSNAVKFTPEGSVALHVTPGAGDRVDFSVQDTGMGIPAHRLGDILEKFTQLDGANSRQHGGAGLGLAIAKHLAGLMGGTITVASTLGEGSRFTLSLPLAPVDGATVLGLDSLPLGGVRLLLVDEHQESREYLRRDLAALGLDVTAVASVAIALGVLRAEAKAGRPIGMCLVNDRANDLQCDAFARVLRRDPSLQHTVLLILVASGVAGDASRLFESGYTAYLAPPLEPDDLRDAVVTAWAQSLSGERTMITRHVLAERRQRGRRVGSITPVEVAAAAPSPRTDHDAPLVLVTDDNDINLHVAAEMLRRIGCRVLQAPGGAEAVALAAEHPLDLVLMDVQMPGMDGFEATARIRAQDQTRGRRTPIVAVTANAMRGDRQKCLDAGMDDYVAKPVSRADLYDAVQRWVAPRPVAAAGDAAG